MGTASRPADTDMPADGLEDAPVLRGVWRYSRVNACNMSCGLAFACASNNTMRRDDNQTTSTHAAGVTTAKAILHSIHNTSCRPDITPHSMHETDRKTDRHADCSVDSQQPASTGQRQHWPRGFCRIRTHDRPRHTQSGVAVLSVCVHVV